jgi:small-conductance mechanosensitive channel
VRGQWLVVVLSLGAAFAFAASNLLKHISAGRVPDAQSLQPTQVGGFIRATLSHPLWLGGIACDIIAVGLQVLALHLGSLSVVQPLLITGLLFALILRPRVEHHRISRRQLSWAVVLTAALAGFLLLATSGQPATARETADRLPAIVAGVLGTVLAAGCIALGLLRARRWSCRSCTPGSQSLPYVADGPTRGSLGTWASRKACTYARSWSIRACT